MMKLYYAPGTISLASHLALECTGADYETSLIDLSGEQHSARFKALNPLGRVPALEVDGVVITETPAILSYIAQRYPDAELLGQGDILGLARANSFNSFLSSTVHVAHAHIWRPERWSDDEHARQSMKLKGPENMQHCFELIERHWLQNQWVLGDQFSVCDLYLFAIPRWLAGDGVEVAQFKKVAAHFTTVANMAPVSRILAQY